MPNPKPIRLLLTITPDKLPEWHACLESIDNGYVRAEFVRKALKKIHPKEIQIMNQAEAAAPEPSNSAPPSPAAPAVDQTQVDNPQVSTGPAGVDVREVDLADKVFPGKEGKGWV